MRVTAIYARASKDNTERRISVDRQVARCEKLAGDLFPDTPVAVYVDNNRSGANPDVDRPGYNAFLAAIRRDEVAEVICHEQSRLTRQPAQWDALVVALTKAGITKVHTVQGGIVPVEPGNRVVGRIMNILDAEEVERTRARILASTEQLAGEGRPNGGRYYGYRRRTGDDGRPVLEVDPDQAAVIRRIADAICAGRSVSSIAAELNADGVPTAMGGIRWRNGAVRSVVSKPAIAGLRAHNGVIVGKARWKAILTEARWKAVQRAMGSAVVYDVNGRARKAPRAHRSRGRRWLLTGGLARCGNCGAPMIVGGQRRRESAVAVDGRRWEPAYQCHTLSGPDACRSVSVNPASLVEEVVVATVLDAVESGRIAAKITDTPDPERARLRGMLHDAEDTMHRAAELRGSGDIDWSTWESMHWPAKARADGAREALAAMTDPEVDLPAPDQIRKRWERLTLRQRRAFLERYLDRVEIKPSRVKGGDRSGGQWARIAERLTPVWKV
jgi:DNA invertase Pin-like site-specific DNA recombinase